MEIEALEFTKLVGIKKFGQIYSKALGLRCQSQLLTITDTQQKSMIIVTIWPWGQNDKVQNVFKKKKLQLVAYNSK